jgi:peptidoglycan/LPS O-acetylase OafA/YrhL
MTAVSPLPSKLFTYRKDIDGLRAVAVLAVILNHAGFAIAGGGYTGVDIFFVISGFLITSIILGELKAGTFTLAGFWERRVRRIIPALLAMMTVIAALGYFLLFPLDYKMLGQQLLAQSVFSSNFLFAAQSGYFDPDSNLKPLLHTWSLAVEEQFYIVFPILLLGLWKYRPGAILPALITIFLLSLTGAAYAFYYAPHISFYMLPVRAWELLLGALMIFLPPIKLARWEKEFLAIVCMSLIIAAIFFYDDKNFLLLPVGLACTGTAFLVWLGRDHMTCVSRILAFPPMVWIGLISYALYLWHWPLFVYARYLSLDEPSASVMSIMIALTFLMASASRIFIEAPVRYKTALPNRPTLFRIMLLLVVMVGGAGAAIQVADGIQSRFPADIVRYEQARVEGDPGSSPCHYKGHTDITEASFCRLGPVSGEPIFLSFGDSFSDSLHPVLNELSNFYRIAGLQISHDSCPPVFDIERPGLPLSYCRDFNDQVRAFIQNRKIRYVLLSARWSSYGGFYRLGPPGSKLSTEEMWIMFRDELIETVDILRTQGIDVWIVRQQPEYGTNIPLRLAQIARQGEDPAKAGMFMEVYKEQQARIDAVLAVAESRGAHIVDPGAVMCSGGLCRIENHGVSLYQDHAHFSPQGADLLRPILEPLFKNMQK